jgi:hypothetical protein
MTSKQTALFWRDGTPPRSPVTSMKKIATTSSLEALGEDKSSKDLTNEDFDKVPRRPSRAISQPDSLNAQLRALNQTAPAPPFTASRRDGTPEYRENHCFRTNSGTNRPHVALTTDELRQLHHHAQVSPSKGKSITLLEVSVKRNEYEKKENTCRNA